MDSHVCVCARALCRCIYTYVYVYIYMDVCTFILLYYVCMCLYTDGHTHILYICICIRTHVCMYVCMRTHAYVYTCTPTVYMSTCAHVLLCMCLFCPQASGSVPEPSAVAEAWDWGPPGWGSARIEFCCFFWVRGG